MTYTHTGYHRQAGHVHTGRLYGHKDYRGKRHALNGTPRTYSGAVYTALCGEKIVAEHDGESFNVEPTAETNGDYVRCRRCLRILFPVPRRKLSES